MLTDVDALESRARALLATAARCLPGAALGQNALPP